VKRYSRAELVAFLRRLDVLLTEQAVLEVVGGAAAVLKYGARAPTKEVSVVIRGSLSRRMRWTAPGFTPAIMSRLAVVCRPVIPDGGRPNAHIGVGHAPLSM
jgi:hypothetical protein